MLFSVIFKKSLENKLSVHAVENKQDRRQNLLQHYDIKIFFIAIYSEWKC